MQRLPYLLQRLKAKIFLSLWRCAGVDLVRYIVRNAVRDFSEHLPANLRNFTRPFEFFPARLWLEASTIQVLCKDSLTNVL